LALTKDVRGGKVFKLVCIPLVFPCVAVSQSVKGGWLVIRNQSLVLCDKYSSIGDFSTEVRSLLATSPKVLTSEINGTKFFAEKFTVIIPNGKTVLCTLMVINPLSAESPVDNYMSKIVFVECYYGGPIVTFGFRDDSSVWIFEDKIMKGLDYLVQDKIAMYDSSGDIKMMETLQYVSKFIELIGNELICSNRVFIRK
jgi:hypothetical protein